LATRIPGSSDETLKNLQRQCQKDLDKKVNPTISRSALLCLTTLTYLDRICISLVGVRVKSAFHLSNEEFGWVLGFSLAYPYSRIPSGILGDKIGLAKYSSGSCFGGHFYGASPDLPVD
jgi:hypothetical protein